MVDTMNTERALLDQALRSNGDVWIEVRAHRLGPIVLVEVEEPHVPLTVVRAISRANAAIVDLNVQAVVAVVDRIHRADRLAGRVLAVLTEHRNEARLDVGELSLPVPLDANPFLRAVVEKQLLVVDGKIVLRLASDHAG